MKSVLRYGLLGLLAFLLCLLLQAPANLVTEQLAKRLPGFSVQTVEGAAINGAAQGVAWRGVRIDRLQWNWQPLALFTGWLEFHLNIDDPEIRFSGNAAVDASQHIRFQKLAGRLLLAKFAVLARQPKLPLQGVVEFDLPDFRLNPDGRPLSASGMIRLIDLKLTLGQPLMLGDFTAQVNSADPEGIQGVVKDNNGPLMLEGNFSLQPDGRYRFNGQAAIRDTENRALRQAMNLLGPPDGDGRWTLSFSGVLSR
ncbi:MAG: type II secretion system protein N [Candidatus Competibacteraceae bacterium]|nr:type II secretion system protein N [Candidatus Competibacteraceae bacterium]